MKPKSFPEKFSLCQEGLFHSENILMENPSR